MPVATPRLYLLFLSSRQRTNMPSRCCLYLFAACYHISSTQRLQKRRLAEARRRLLFLAADVWLTTTEGELLRQRIWLAASGAPCKRRTVLAKQRRRAGIAAHCGRDSKALPIRRSIRISLPRGVVRARQARGDVAWRGRRQARGVSRGA